MQPAQGRVRRVKDVAARLLHVRPGEGSLVLWTFALSLLIGIPRVFTFTCANTLFLRNHSAGDLPYVYMATALLIPALGVINLRVQKTHSAEATLTSSLWIIIVALLGLQIWLASGVSEGATGFIALLWYQAEVSLTGLAYWGVLNAVFTANQGKRLFALVGTGEMLSSILGGLIAPHFVERWGLLSLLWCSTAGAAGALAVLLRIRRQYGGRFQPEVAESDVDGGDRQSPRELLRLSYVRRILAVYAVPGFCMYYLVDNLWMAHVQRRYTSEADLAAFYSGFMAAIGAATLLFRLVLSSRILARVGVRGGLLLPPLVLVGLLGTLYGYEQAGATAAALWIAVALKLSERVSTATIHFPAYNMLYQPLGPEQKVRVLSLVETLVGPLVGLVTSVGLLAANRIWEVSPTGLAGLALIAGPLYLAAAYLAGTGYRTALAKALSAGSLSFERMQWTDASSVAVLAEALHGNSAREVAYCTRLLARVEHPAAGGLLLKSLGHDDPSVRAAAYASIEAQARPEHARAVVDALEAEQSDELRAAGLGAIAATDPAAGEARLAELIGAIDPATASVRAAAISAALRYGDEGLKALGQRALEELCHSSSADDRVQGAAVLGAVSSGELAHFLGALLADDDADVCRAACSAVAGHEDPGLWLQLVDNLQRPGVRAVACRVLLDGATGALDALRQAHAMEGQDASLRTELVRLAAMSPNRDAIPFLVAVLDEPEVQQVSIALRGLIALGYHPDDDMRLREMLDQCLARLQEVRALVAATDAGPDSVFLHAALAEEARQLQTRGLRLAALCHPGHGIERVIDILDSDLSRHNDLAAELLDSAVEGADRRWVTILLEPLPTPATPDHSNIRLQVATLLTAGPHGHTRWTWACIQDAAARLGLLKADMRLSATAMRTEPEKMGTLHKVYWLKNADLFRLTASDRLLDFADGLKAGRFSSGTQIFAAGDTCTELFVVVSGTVRVEVAEGEPVLLGRGDVFGELAALVPVPRSAVVRVEDDAVLLEIFADDLLAFMETDGEVVGGVIRVLADRLRSIGGVRESAPPASGLKQVDASASLTQLQRVVAFRSTSLFSGVEEGIVHSLASGATERHLRPGEFLFLAGEPGDRMFLVHRGTLRVQRDGHRLAEVSDGGIIGELAVLTPEVRSADVVAIDHVHVLGVRRRAVEELMSKYPSFARSIVVELVRRLRSGLQH